ncbi:MAG: mandelate racemase/muconate lactonizing enzyme family protein, partial [Chloroflexota bacterium]|nr:mandelate racemase/muconate lactonizing enzyme family protein [Chloroflexota bacterium]
MKITKIETYLVNIGHRNWPFVKVHTDEGLYGIGEAYSCGPDQATVKVIHDFAEWLVGRDPRDIEGLYHLMYAGSRFPGGSVVNAAISGIEHALWDILGKSVGEPVYRLLGGKCRDKVRVYGHIGGNTPQEVAAKAQELIGRYGYTCLKLEPAQPPDSQALTVAELVKAVEARMKAAREAVGDGVDIAADMHGMEFEPARALAVCQALAPYNPFFVEEPLRPENIGALAELARKVDVPIATGEMLYTKYQFNELIRERAAHVVQPDITLAGGLLEQKKIAALAEANYAVVAPHNPCGPVANAVNLHFAASTPNFLVLEYIPD